MLSGVLCACLCHPMDRGEDKRLRKSVPFLAEKYQDAVGTTIFLGTHHLHTYLYICIY